MRTRFQLHRVLEGIEAEPGPVLSTVLDGGLRTELEKFCSGLGLALVNVLDPVLSMLQEQIGAQAAARPGRQYVLDADYFRRIDAMHYVLAHDDGQAQAGIPEADVVLVGVSRSSKTPTSFYLANRGIKAANVPPGARPAGPAGARGPALPGRRPDARPAGADRDPAASPAHDRAGGAACGRTAANTSTRMR